MLNDARVSASGRQLLTTEAPGYLLDLSEDEVDVGVFEKLVRRAQWELSEGSPEGASRHLVTARELMRGPILSNVPHGSVLASRVAHFEELRLRALEFWVETENRLGRHRELLPELRTLVDDYPLHEWFHGELISALYRAGRRAEALEAYQNLYRILKRELGLEPAPELRQLQARILDSTVTEIPAQLSRFKERRPAPHGAPPFWTSTAADPTAAGAARRGRRADGLHPQAVGSAGPERCPAGAGRCLRVRPPGPPSLIRRAVT
ncbi:AfsR/SARP family transcriptional regulator [Streptomyces nogalater]